MPSLRFRNSFLMGAFVTAMATQSALAEETFITITNSSEHVIKVAAPGGKSQRVPPGEEIVTMPLETTDPNGIDVKAWWVSRPRELCVIFVRYEGLLKVAGKKSIRCLGN